ncbi:hypothetical protein GDO78_010430 [Eleutherodactylus coqui]|uniref:Helicase C-terminal domain-containing protein n=2 Tax=Eleutherodactylus coqui TaxID=57060 RepID=A0A8J6F5U9_ELECQ|nr:hypothetical protein GDO78_010430 [Eleutherodactylus coqui]
MELSSRAAGTGIAISAIHQGSRNYSPTFSGVFCCDRVLPDPPPLFCACTPDDDVMLMRRSPGAPGKFKISWLPAPEGSREPGEVTGSDVKRSFIYSHPKLKKLEEVVIEHFKNWNKPGQSSSTSSPPDTRVMIFSSFRDSVQEIAEMLNQHHPIVRVMTFVGHASTGKGVKGFTQKEQLEVVKRFREGGYNTLVSTCVGEEGLDIGEVDLIICFDAQKSPVRLVQRMGRTGRKRQGRIVVILCQGREERTYNQSQCNKRSIYKAIMGNNTDLHLHQQSPRMVPDGINPAVHKMYITQASYDVKEETASKDGRSSVAHRKSAVFSKKERSMKEDGFLTNAEFETWDRLYHLKESDGITDVVLPKPQFALFKDADTIVEVVPEKVHELSLSEWSLWQNRPFPTDSVDHSHRCKNFIGAMELIEQMRLEENGCKYDEEMKAILQKESIQPVHKGTKDNRVCPTTNSKAKKKSIKNAQTCKISTLFSSVEPDEDFRSTSKASKSTRSGSAEFLNTDSVVDTSKMEEASAINIDLEHDDDKANDMEIEEYEESSKNRTNLRGVSTKDCQSTMLESPPKTDCGNNHGDDYPASLLSSFFYTPPSLNTYDIPTEFTSNSIYEVKQMLSHVKQFLAHSPPPLAELDSLVNLDISAQSLTDRISSVPHKTSEHPSLHLQVRNSLHHNHLSPSDLEDAPSTTEVNEEEPCKNTVSASVYQEQDRGDNMETNDTNDLVVEEPLHDSLWDDMFDCDPGEAYIENVDPPAAYNHAIHGGHGKVSTKNNEDFDTTSIDNVFKKPEKTENHVRIEGATFSCNSSLIPDQNNRKNEDTDIDFPRAHSPSHSERTEYPPGLKEDEFNSFPDGLDDSFDLFEDEEFVQIDQVTSSEAGIINKSNNRGTSVNFNIFDPSLLSEDTTELEAEDQACSNATENTKQEDLDFDGSQELFSVKFDLGFSIEDDSSEGEDDGLPKNECEEEPSHLKARSPPEKVAARGGIMSTPLTSASKNSICRTMSEKHISLLSPLYPIKDKFSQTLEKSNCSVSFLKSPTKKLDNTKTPFNTLAKYNLHTPPKMVGVRSENTPTVLRSGENQPEPRMDHSRITGSGSDSEEDVVFRRKRKLTNADVLRSPETPSSECDFDSPVPTTKKRRHVLSTLVSDDESFDQPSVHHKGNGQNSRKQKEVQQLKRKKQHAARKFLDDEADLSSEEAELVSSDESSDSENQQDTSLVGFLNDNTQLSQGLNDSEMCAVYLKSVRSPAAGSRFKLVHKRHSMAVFSQIPEQDESYMEDSFCVEEEDEEEKCSTDEEVQVDFDLLQEDSFVGGRKQYFTRRRLKLDDAQSNQNRGQPIKKKRRILIHDDSSDEEPGVTSKLKVNSPPENSSKLSSFTKPPPDGTIVKSKGSASDRKNVCDVPLADRCQLRLNLQASLSNKLDFQPDARSSVNISRPGTSNGLIRSSEKLELCNKKMESSWTASVTKTPVSTACTGGPCILADSREISSGPEVITYLRTTHGVRVDICSLGGCDYIVSNRLSVERKSQSEFSNSANRSKLVERIKHLRSMFERVCLIVEKDRVKPGETSRLFQRTKYYDSTLSSLISAGVQVLFSSSQEETAALLKELVSLEQRKNTGITVPTQVSGHKQEVLNFYLSIPNVSYITALNLCHHVPSVSQITNSSVEEIVSKGNVSKQKAEEIYCYLHYVFDPKMLQPSDKRKQSVV